MKKWWKYSSLRFYFLNAVWNYGFWIKGKKKYKEVSYYKRDFFRNNTSQVTKRKFEGYLYNGKTYLDNPGIQVSDRDVWEAWKKRGLI